MLQRVGVQPLEGIAFGVGPQHRARAVEQRLRFGLPQRGLLVGGALIDEQEGQLLG